MVVPWSRKSSLGPVKIASFLCLVLFKDEGRRLSPRSLRDPSDRKILLRSSTSC